MTTMLHKRYIAHALLVGVALYVLLVPSAVHAASFFPIVPCGITAADGSTPTPCTPCHLFQALKNVIDLVLYGITGPIAAFLVVLAGGMMLLGGGNATLYSQGKGMLTNTLIGVAVILLSWVATNFLIKSIATGSGDNAWYQFTCPAFLETAGDETVLATPGPSRGSAQQPAAVLVRANTQLCGDKAQLAGAYKSNTNPQAIAPSLRALMTAIESDPIVKALIDSSQTFTYERTNPLCNLTHGYPVCGACQHSRNSCHYGGKTGTQGAMGVDYNWKPGKSVIYLKSSRTIVSEIPKDADKTKYGTATGEPGLFDAIYCAIQKQGLESKVGLLNYEGNHTHISTSDCDVDAHDGIKGKVPSSCGN